MSLQAAQAEKPLRGALVGLGNVAIQAHLPMWRRSRDFQIAAVVEPCRERARMAADLLPGRPVYPNLEKLLARSPIDFVDICTPPRYHGEAILAACRSGLHVFCEKPLVTSRDDYDRVLQAQRRSDNVVFTVNNWKYAPLWNCALSLVREGRIGQVRSVTLQVLRTSTSGGGAIDWRKRPDIAGGGILLDHGWHNLYLIGALIGQHPQSISVEMGFAASWAKDLEDEVDLTLFFPSAEARLHLSWRSKSRRNDGKIQGDGGVLWVNDDHLLLAIHGEAPRRYDFPQPLSAGSHHPEWMIPVMEAFSSEIRDQNARGTNLGEAGFCTRLIDLAYRSHRTDPRISPVPPSPGWKYP